jgi:hypothetical protein
VTSYVIVATVIAILVISSAVWLFPRRQVARWRRAGIEEHKLAELSIQARSSVTQAFGGLALIATLAITAYQVNETRRTSDRNLHLVEQGQRSERQSQVSERFSRAVEQLGATNANGDDPAIDVRTGALFSLLRIGLDSPENTQSAFLVVAAYIQNNYQRPKTLRKNGCAGFRSPRGDVRTALKFVLPRVAEKLYKLRRGKGFLTGLRGSDLSGLDVDGLDFRHLSLTRTKFRAAYLVRANFRQADIRGSSFARACLLKAHFRWADLRLGADLRRANLIDADFSHAKLERADFRGAKLSRSTNFTAARLRGAKFTRTALDLVSLSNAQKHEIAGSR